MSVLRGPNEADNFRIKVGRFGDRFYTNPLPTCEIAEASDWVGPSITLVKKANSSDWSYVAMKRCAKDLALKPVKYAAGDAEANYELFKVANKVGLSVDGGRGQIIHLWCEDLLAGKPMRTFTDLDLAARKLPREALEQALRYQAAVQAFFDTYQPELIAAEVVCIHQTLNGVGYGGTADALIRIADLVYAVDWKSRGNTSDHDAYSEEAAQVGGLAGAQYMIIAGGDGAVRAPLPKIDSGLIVSIKPDGCRVYPIDLDKAFEHFSHLHAWWVASRDEKASIGRSWAPKAVPAVDLEPVLAASLTAAAAKRRVKAIIDAGHAERLAQVWPADTPGFAGKHKHDADELANILTAIRQVENETSMPFNGEDFTPPAPVAPAELLEPPAEHPDGPLMSDAHRDALNARYAVLDGVQRATIRPILDALDIPHSTTVLGNPHQRIWSICRAAVLWAEAGWDDEVIRDLASAVTDDEAIRQLAFPMATIFAALTVEQADELTDMAKLVLGNTHILDHTADHWTLKPAA